VASTAPCQFFIRPDRALRRACSGFMVVTNLWVCVILRFPQWLVRMAAPPPF
jgi:hypothetical protein